MYRINSIRDGEWEIIDATGRIVFIGTPDECEEVLDYRENLTSKQSALSTWFARLFGRSQSTALPVRDACVTITPRPRVVPLSWPELRMPRAH